MRLAILILSVFQLVTLVSGEAAHCPTTWTLLSPQLHTPCQIATTLGQLSTCAGSDFHIDSLDPEYSYGPGPAAYNPPLACFCTDIMYNTIAACAACQNGDWYARDAFFVNCTSINNFTSFPTDDLSIWMTVPYIPTFNLTTALQIAGVGTGTHTTSSAAATTPASSDSAKPDANTVSVAASAAYADSPAHRLILGAVMLITIALTLMA